VLNISAKIEEACHEITTTRNCVPVGTFEESRIKILSGKGGGVYGIRKTEA